MRQLLHDARRRWGHSLRAGGAYPEPIEHCAICRWSADCDRQRRDDDDLSLVAGMPTTQRVALKQAGIRHSPRVRGPGRAPRLGRRSPASLARAQLQARLQVESEDAGTIHYELLDPEVDQEGAFVPNRGLLALPEPAVGDLFFDIEGARYYSEDAEEFGLQYLFGIVDTARLPRAASPPTRSSGPSTGATRSARSRSSSTSPPSGGPPTPACTCTTTTTTKRRRSST